MKTQQDISSNVIRAWIDTVLAPIFGGLELSQTFLKTDNWTWKHGYETLEHLRPAREYIDERARWNLKQFEEVCAESPLFSMLDTHAERVRDLADKCSLEYRTYTECSRLLSTIDELLPEMRPDAAPRVYNNSAENQLHSHDHDYLLEYLVNNRKEIPTFYVLSRFWRANRSHLFDIIESTPDLASAKEATRTAGEALNDACQNASDQIWRQMNTWSLDRGLPIVASAS